MYWINLVLIISAHVDSGDHKLDYVQDIVEVYLNTEVQGQCVLHETMSEMYTCMHCVDDNSDNNFAVEGTDIHVFHSNEDMHTLNHLCYS